MGKLTTKINETSALVTSGASGLGRPVDLRLAQLGIKVILLDLPENALQQSLTAEPSLVM
jgi:short-subunit dehydrogenase involved in D-alanine esterification of teichoic acids